MLIIQQFLKPVQRFYCVRVRKAFFKLDNDLKCKLINVMSMKLGELVETCQDEIIVN